MSVRKFRERQIIIFRGIKLKDIGLGGKVYGAETSRPYIEQRYFAEIPRYWTEGDPLVPTELKCWNCDTTFAGDATFIPMNPRGRTNDISSSITFERFGNYCSWPCAARDAYHRFRHDRNYTDIKQGLRLVFNSLYSLDVTYVKMAPDKSCVSDYCGNGGMSRADYHEAIKKIQRSMEE